MNIREGLQKLDNLYDQELNEYYTKIRVGAYRYDIVNILELYM